MTCKNRQSPARVQQINDGGEDARRYTLRLSSREWGVVCVVVGGVLLAVPALWDRAEPFTPSVDHRTPYELSEDYWLYARLVQHPANRSKILVIGDSVIWGQYVSPDQTLTHYLNACAGEDRFSNLALNGTHPAALAGLIEHYCSGVSDRRVLLHCNPLWIGSPKHDLQDTEGQVNFNHPHLVAQFVPWIPSYRATVRERISVVAERRFPHNRWARHLRITYFGNMDVPRWTVEHPRENPFASIGLEIPSPGAGPRRRPVSWRSAGVPRTDLPWVDLDKSLQWRSFRRSLDVLMKRRNRVFVCVGPLNEHMLTERSQARYAAVKRGIEGWLRDNDIAHFAPALLPSDLYADLSHPLSEGYARLARELYQNESFASFADGDSPRE